MGTIRRSAPPNCNDLLVRYFGVDFGIYYTSKSHLNCLSDCCGKSYIGYLSDYFDSCFHDEVFYSNCCFCFGARFSDMKALVRSLDNSSIFIEYSDIGILFYLHLLNCASTASDDSLKVNLLFSLSVNLLTVLISSVMAYFSSFDKFQHENLLSFRCKLI